MADRGYAVVRHREAVLGCDEAGVGTLPSAPVEGDPPTTLRSIQSELGLEGVIVERRAEDEGSVVWLLSVDERDATAGDRCPAPTWSPPGQLFDRWGDDWRRYRSVAPTVETVTADRERGSSALAADALWVLRDAATEADGIEEVRDVAERLLAARPAMAALANRVNRAMAGADSPSAVQAAATEGLVRAHEADAEAAELAAATVDGGRVLTLSRSGTVRAALLAARPRVEVLASLPGGEGNDVAGSLSDAGLSVTVVPDARVYERLRSGAIDAVVVGADAVDTDGSVWNKVGTRAAALAAERAGVPFYAVCASDKVRPGGTERPTADVHDPLFDRTPPRLVTAILTERGRLAPAAVAEVAAEHRRWERWRG